MSVTITLNGEKVYIESDIFESLFRNSIVSNRVDVRNALAGKLLPFKTFLSLTYDADIPYPLFFASKDVVNEQIKLKTDKLMAGFTKATFSMHSRNLVQLSDVELIVKDLLRKQELFKKYDSNLTSNSVVGILRKSRGTVTEDVRRLMDALNITWNDLRMAKSREVALEYLIGRLEAKQIMVARGVRSYMPQEIPSHAKFSGMTIKDNKVPFIFLANGNENDNLEPTGRRLFTLVLLTVLTARGTFAPVTYNGHTTDSASPREYELTAEILMPAREFNQFKLDDIEALKNAAERFKVTPSAVAMRAWRLNRMDRSSFERCMDILANEYNNRGKVYNRSPNPINSLRRYNGTEFSRRMLEFLDEKRISHSEFRRIVFLNKIPLDMLNDFRKAVHD